MLKYIKDYLWTLAAEEVHDLSCYFERTWQYKPLGHERFDLLKKIPNGKPVDSEKTDFADQLVLINGNFNYSLDIVAELKDIYKASNRRTRLAVVLYNPYLRSLYKLLSAFGMRRAPLPPTFITRQSFEGICKLAGFEITKERLLGYFPLRLFGLGSVINYLCSSLPAIRSLGLFGLYILRPVKVETTKPLLSVVVPARNEKGNIQSIIDRVNALDLNLELIFVEGNSTDGTWEALETACHNLKVNDLPVKLYKQKGKGKADAVRMGFQHASGEVLTILDADLTVEPEQLVVFYNAYVSGLADFVNGSRLVYPMEGAAMRFLNHLGNIFFAKSLRYVLEIPIGDSLCGTKLFSRIDYERMTLWRSDFGDFDPFGDFELLFPASSLALGTIDVPIHYKDRVYGTTNIQRFRHGLMLLKMTTIGLVRMKLRFRGKYDSNRKARKFNIVRVLG